MSQMLKSSGAMGAATLTSRVLGLVREMVYARFMGTGWVADAFMFAFTIPNLFRRLLGEGALTAAFIPIFKEKEKLGGEKQMWAAANAVISALLVAALAVVIGGMLVISGLLYWVDLAPKTRLMLELLRQMFPYLLLVCVAAIFMGMLNARGHFFIPAFGSALLNVVLIGSVLLLAPRLGGGLERQIFGLALGVLIAGLVQAIFQWPLLRKEGFRYRWVSPWGDETVRRVVRQMIPGIIGVAAFQMNVAITYGFGFFVGDEIVSSFNYAVRLMELPQGVFGVSLATFLLPTLAGLAAEKKYPEFRGTLSQGLGYLLFINVLASVLLFVLAEPIIRLLFEGRRFDAAATHRAAFALTLLAPGLVAFSGVNILARAFYAVGDMQTPMKVSIFCLGLNTVLAAVLVWPMQQGGLALANTLTSILNAALLARALRRKLARLDWDGMQRHAPGIVAAGLVAGAIAWAIAAAWQQQFAPVSMAHKLGEVFLPMLGASVGYLALNWWLKVPYVGDLLAMLGPRGGGSLPKDSG